MSLLASELFPALIMRPVADICCQLNIVDSLAEIFPCGLWTVSLAGHVSLLLALLFCFSLLITSFGSVTVNGWKGGSEEIRSPDILM